MLNSTHRAISVVVLWAALSPAIARAQVDAIPFAPPEDIRFRTQDIMSEGTRMAAELFSLKSLDGKRLPTILLCHGWGGTAKDLRPEGIAFARAGYLAATFDYRGWGASDARLVLTGPAPAERLQHRFKAEVKEVREVVDPLDQTTDLLNSIHWAQ